MGFSLRMTTLVTGAQGFVGSYLINYLASKREKCVGLNRFKSRAPASAHFSSKIKWQQGDLVSRKKMHQLIQKIMPTMVYHLAAQSSVASSWEDPTETFKTNVLGTMNLLDALCQLKRPSTVLIVGSGEVYGRASLTGGKITEESPLSPENPYAASKAAQDFSLLPYLRNAHLKLIRVRPFNHIGPGQSHRFVVSHFAYQIARIEKGLQKPIIQVGNLKAKRDFTDVRDIIRAYTLLRQKGKHGEVYNIARGKPIAIGTILKKLLSLSKSKIHVHVDKNLLRPNDIPVLYSSSKKLFRRTGWSPQISLERSLTDILNFWRAQRLSR